MGKFQPLRVNTTIKTHHITPKRTKSSTIGRNQLSTNINHCQGINKQMTKHPSLRQLYNNNAQPGKNCVENPFGKNSNIYI